MICLTFDVEERFHSHLTPPDAPRRWDAGARISQILDILEAGNHRATFFLVSELAEHYPQLVRRMADSGFEIASHSHSHMRMDGDDPERCKSDIARSKTVLEDLSGTPVVGFRAPSWSARRSDGWLWDHLVELGFRYDSSLFPFKTHLYGSMRNPLTPYRVHPELVEIPPSVSRVGPLRLPYGGGFYFRLYPRWLTRRLIGRDQRRSKMPIAYFHPWEFDPAPERMERDWLNRFIANLNGGDSWDKFQELLAEHRTTAMIDMLDDLRDVAVEPVTDGGGQRQR